MGAEIYQYRVTLDHYLALFPAVMQPRYVGDDFIADFGAARTSGNNDLRFDPIARCVTPRRIYVPHHNLLPGTDASALATYPQVNWSTPTTGGGIASINQIALPHQNYEVQAGSTTGAVGTFSSTAALSPFCQGFRFDYNIGAEQTDPSNPTTLTLSWRLGSPAEGGDGDKQSNVWYRLVVTIGTGARIDRSADNASTWLTLGAIRSGGRGDQIAQPYTVQPRLSVEVLFIGGMMQVSLDSDTVPWSTPEIGPYGDGDDTFPWAITTVAVDMAQADQVRFAVHPAKWLSQVPAFGGDGTPFVSGDINLGFVPLTFPTWTVQYAPNPDWIPSYVLRDTDLDTVGYHPPGCGATISTLPPDSGVPSTLLNYELSFSNSLSTAGLGGRYNVDYFSDFTAAVRAATYSYPEILGPTRGSEPISLIVEQMDLDVMFDVGQLTIRSNGSLQVNNFDGAIALLCDESGNLAVTIDYQTDGGPWERLFTGVANADFSEDNIGGDLSHVTVTLDDNWMSVDTESFALPWMDGWNSYYAIAFLGNLGGIASSRMQFFQDGLVPDDRYGLTPGDDPTNPQNTFFLPVGPAGTPLTRFDNGAIKGDVARRIARQQGNMIYFDAFGNWNFKPFFIPNAFPDILLTPYATEDYREILAGMRYNGTTRETRNSVTTIGLQAFGNWDPLVSHQVDPDMWDDTLPGFIGFPNPMVWADPMFGDLAFATQVAQDVLNVVKRPVRKISCSKWFNANTAFGLLSKFAVVDCPRSGANNKTFLCVQVGIHTQKGQPPKQRIAGRWIENVPHG